ncbi:MAG: hypothetical protein RJQ14_19805 [Marinoscillum sp.]
MSKQLTSLVGDVSANEVKSMALLARFETKKSLLPSGQLTIRLA